ncbi:Uncharacterized protein TCM_012177 [Theobroma cacao]|uniref:Uncharacterized protein n=1 Tax=Theobroma cacao TaxID=3641 RepID=A0A061FVD7_THECC|nr:Uncharacterized protein TCM_012177 [Theobroma cacao]
MEGRVLRDNYGTILLQFSKQLVGVMQVWLNCLLLKKPCFSLLLPFGSELMNLSSKVTVLMLWNKPQILNLPFACNSPIPLLKKALADLKS